MPLGTAHTTITTAAVFIPELWSDEVAATYKMNLVVANHVTKLNHKGKRGDVVHIPVPTRGVASIKAAETQVTLQAATDGEKTITINKHYEYSKLIEDITAVQALASMRQFYTNDAGYALATRVDRELHLLGAALQGGVIGTAATNYGTAVIGGDGSTLFGSENGTALTDLGLRTMIQKLDDQDVPLTERCIIIPPVEKKNLTGLSRFTEQAFVGEAGAGNTIRNGLVGDVYGHKIYVSTNCPWVHTDDGQDEAYVTFSSANPTGTDELGTTVAQASPGDKFRAGMLIHRSALALVEQLGVTSLSQYKQEYLSWLYTGHTIFGVGEIRDYAGIAFIVPA
jgi:hypothetical protein